MKEKIFTGLVILLLFNGAIALAEVRLPKLFTDNMVLQRDQLVQIWGWAKPSEKINASFAGNKYNTKADESGEWSFQIPPTSAGGPYDLYITGENKIHLANILFGDIWICSGQSNMHFKLKSASQAYKETDKAMNDNIRLFQIDQDSYFQPREDLKSGSWQLCTPETVHEFSAVAYFYGKELYEETDIPIGLIQATWGGSIIQAWMDKESFVNINDYKEIISSIEQSPDYFSRLEKEYMENGGDLLVKAIYKQSAGLTIDGELSDSTDFFDSGWEIIPVPGYWEKSGLPKYDGTVWYRKVVEVPSAFNDRDLLLKLGWIDDYDFSFFNGKPIGKTYYKGSGRNYIIPKEYVLEGENEILVCVYDNGGLGGFWGPQKPLLKLNNDESELQLDLGSVWHYKADLEKCNIYVEKANIMPRERSIPTFLYNAMISPLTQFAIKGVIWYQGEGNAGNANEYMELFPAMIKGWRRAWDQGDFPFLYVQLPNYGIPDSLPGQSDWAELREVQQKTLSLPNTGMAVTIDLGNEMNIHPINKKDVSKRLALAALKIAYKKETVFSGPIYDSMKIYNGKVHISFSHVGGGLMAQDKFAYLKEFSIAGSDKKFIWAKAYVEGNHIVVYSEKISEPVAVRYAWSGNPSQANLYNKEGLPASPFRTDSWIDEKE